MFKTKDNSKSNDLQIAGYLIQAPQGHYQISNFIFYSDKNIYRFKHPLSILVDVRPNQTTYLGRMTFEPHEMKSGFGRSFTGYSFGFESQWEIDKPVLENQYPSLNFSETNINIPVLPEILPETKSETLPVQIIYY